MTAGRKTKVKVSGFFYQITLFFYENGQVSYHYGTNNVEWKIKGDIKVSSNIPAVKQTYGNTSWDVVSITVYFRKSFDTRFGDKLKKVICKVANSRVLNRHNVELYLPTSGLYEFRYRHVTIEERIEKALRTAD